MKDLLGDAAKRAASYLEGLPNRPVAPTPQAIEGLLHLRLDDNKHRGRTPVFGTDLPIGGHFGWEA